MSVPGIPYKAMTTSQLVLLNAMCRLIEREKPTLWDAIVVTEKIRHEFTEHYIKAK